MKLNLDPCLCQFWNFRRSAFLLARGVAIFFVSKKRLLVFVVFPAADVISSFNQASYFACFMKDKTRIISALGSIVVLLKTCQKKNPNPSMIDMVKILGLAPI